MAKAAAIKNLVAIRRMMIILCAVLFDDARACRCGESPIGNHVPSHLNLVLAAATYSEGWRALHAHEFTRCVPVDLAVVAHLGRGALFTINALGRHQPPVPHAKRCPIGG